MTNDVSAVVFIVDSADAKRFPEAKESLDSLLSCDELTKVPFLILGNKIDKKGSCSESDLKAQLGLDGLTTGKNNFKRDVRPIEVFMCSILNQTGYAEGFQWVSTFLN